MSKYNSFQKGKEVPKNSIHPVWRGIGCLITILTPIISWAAAAVCLEFGQKQQWPFLYQLSANIRFSAIFYQIPLVKIGANFISSIPYLQALILFFVLFLVLFSGVFSVINAVLYRMFGPPRYSPLDAPAPRVKTKRYTR
jgi:hypothetical protein